MSFDLEAEALSDASLPEIESNQAQFGLIVARADVEGLPSETQPGAVAPELLCSSSEGEEEEEFDEEDFDDDFDDDFEDELDEELNEDLDEFDEDIEESEALDGDAGADDEDAAFGEEEF